MEEKKIRVTLPEIAFDIISQDISDFGINKNKLCNMIFGQLNETTYDIEVGFRTSQTKVLQFNLTVRNKYIFKNLLERNKISKEAAFFRNIFLNYCNQPKYKREQQLFLDNYQLVNEAIKNKCKLKIEYKKAIRIVEPYFVKNSEGESRNYVFSYCYTNKQFRNYRLANFKAIALIHEHVEFNDLQLITSYKRNFDPFLSNGKTVKIKLSPKGIEHYRKVITNRPKLISKRGDIYIFESSIDKAKIYFPQFFVEAEILYPKELREWFIEMFRKSINNYKRKN